MEKYFISIIEKHENSDRSLPKPTICLLQLKAPAAAVFSNRACHNVGLATPCLIAAAYYACQKCGQNKNMVDAESQERHNIFFVARCGFSRAAVQANGTP